MAPRPRRELHSILKDILGSGNVYFQPPPSIKLEYPCIIYNVDDWNIQHADNGPYQHQKRYLVTVVDKNPDSDIPERVAMLPSVRFSRSYASDHLNHTAFRLYF